MLSDTASASVDAHGIKKVLRFGDFTWPYTPLNPPQFGTFRRAASLFSPGSQPKLGDIIETVGKLPVPIIHSFVPNFALLSHLLTYPLIHSDAKKRKENLEKFTWITSQILIRIWLWLAMYVEEKRLLRPFRRTRWYQGRALSLTFIPKTFSLDHCFYYFGKWIYK